MYLQGYSRGHQIRESGWASSHVAAKGWANSRDARHPCCLGLTGMSNVNKTFQKYCSVMYACVGRGKPIAVPPFICDWLLQCAMRMSIWSNTVWDHSKDVRETSFASAIGVHISIFLENMDECRLRRRSRKDVRNEIQIEVKDKRNESNYIGQAAWRRLFTGAIPLLINAGTFGCCVSTLTRYVPPSTTWWPKSPPRPPYWRRT